jgi:hypothetical protein
MRSLLLCLLIFVASAGLAGEQAISAFSATYTLHKGGLQVGEADLSMEQLDGNMRWQLSSRATGMYALLTSKKPYSESFLKSAGNDYQLASVTVSGNREDQPTESARFNWSENKLEVQRKGKSKVLTLKNNVFDYLSIHWLSAQMTINAGSKTEIDFYRKGKLVKSSLKLIGVSEINTKDKTRSVRLYEQSFKKSKTRYQYYYDLKNPLLPIKIERIKPGKDSTIMLFKHLN